ncbi:phage tail protein [Variovorax sp. CY25R-8]|uniref:phage tail-collar fiber domain-containing protein n=1 Tax=Variovorax sp. CY25R-8 TaxID=2855501 RepID=UPI0021BB09A5|nr:phage tail protein [Variovorax sp. CY25R-8]MCT8178129.1 phage tail protein [Variovorax sp. CY25R-8]
MAFTSIHTTHGLRETARAIATGSQIELMALVIGDGGGNPMTPDVEMTALVRERWRGDINRVYKDPGDATLYIAEAIVPAAVGGWTIREGGLIDSTGALFTVCNLPDSYKPLPSEGTASDFTIRIAFQPGNADTVVLQLDPNVTIATQSWVFNYVNGGNVFPGGTTGQVLTKVSNADGDAHWEDIDAINVTVDTVEETQTLATDQTVVDLTVTTTRGLALYIDGVRLRADEWTKHPTIASRLTLATSYPAGTKLIAAQNEPTGNAPDPLLRSKNLSDIENAATARSNLGVYSKEESDRAGPIGMPAHWPSANLPTGWLIRNGAAISRTAYPVLFAVLGTLYGAGDGFTTFNLPDDRGHFDGGADMGRGLDPAMALGIRIDSQNKTHWHSVTMENAGSHDHPVTVRAGGRHSHQLNTSSVFYNATGGPLPFPATLGAGAGIVSSGTTEAGDHGHEATASPNGLHKHTATANPSGEAHARPNTRAYVPIIRAL